MSDSHAQKEPLAPADKRSWGQYLRLLFCANHKSVGTLYLAFSIFAGILGGVLSIAMRLELQEPGIQFFNGLASMVYGYSGEAALDGGRRMYSVFTTAHALIMLFFMAMPALIGGFANWMVPIMIGAPDMAFPRLNALSFWLMVTAFVLLVLSMFVGGGAAGEWSAYSPFEVMVAHPGTAGAFVTVALYAAAVSGIFLAINLITTIINMRAPGMLLRKMPLFVWSVLIAAFLLLLSLPVMAGTVTMALAGRSLALTGEGADLAAQQQLFWFVGHPEIYILILPAFGITSEIVATFARRPVIGHFGMICAMIAIAAAGFMIWADHMYAPGSALGTDRYFALAAIVVSVPTGFQLCCWIATLWRAEVRFSTPVIWTAGFIFILVAGAVTGLQLVAAGWEGSSVSASHGVAHFHYMLSLGAVFAVFAAWYYWFPKMSGYLCCEAIGKLHFWVMFIGVNLMSLPQLLGLANLAMRQIDHPAAFSAWNFVSSAGSYISGFGVLIFLYGVCEAFVRKRRAGDSPWGKEAATLEWHLSSPPPERQWENVPHIR